MYTILSSQQEVTLVACSQCQRHRSISSSRNRVSRYNLVCLVKRAALQAWYREVSLVRALTWLILRVPSTPYSVPNT